MPHVSNYSGFRKGASVSPELFSAIVGALSVPAIGAALIEPDKNERWYSRLLTLLGLTALGGGLGYAGGVIVPRAFGATSATLTPELAALGLLTTAGAGTLYGAAAIERARRRAAERLISEMEKENKLGG